MWRDRLRFLFRSRLLALVVLYGLQCSRELLAFNESAISGGSTVDVEHWRGADKGKANVGFFATAKSVVVGEGPVYRHRLFSAHHSFQILCSEPRNLIFPTRPVISLSACRHRIQVLKVNVVDHPCGHRKMTRKAETLDTHFPPDFRGDRVPVVLCVNSNFLVPEVYGKEDLRRQSSDHLLARETNLVSSGIRALLPNAGLANQEYIRNQTRDKKQSGEDSYLPIHSKLTTAVASLLFLILPLLSFYYIKTSIDNLDGFDKRRFVIGVSYYVVAHLFGFYVLLPILGL